jgi:hypothetical protein
MSDQLRCYQREKRAAANGFVLRLGRLTVAVSPFSDDRRDRVEGLSECGQPGLAVSRRIRE